MSMEKARNYNLDIVRIIAILFVVLVHVDNNYGSWHGFASWGWKGVPLFFILSGYLAAVSYEGHPDTKAYYFRRFIRIIPTYYFALILNYMFDVACDLLFNGHSIRETFGYYGIGGIRYWRYFVFVNMCIPSEQPQWWNNRYALWTMPAFALFYLLVPLIHRFIKRTEIGLAVALVLMWIVPYASVWVVSWPINNIDTVAYQNPFFQMPVFLLGYVIYLAICQKKQMLLGATVAVIAIMTGLQWNAFELLFVLFMMIAAELSAMTLQPFTQRFVQSLSDSSFTIYLTHGIVLNTMVVLVAKALGNGSSYLKFVIVFAGTVIISFLIWKWVIGPMDRWIRKRVFSQKKNEKA